MSEEQPLLRGSIQAADEYELQEPLARNGAELSSTAIVATQIPSPEAVIIQLTYQPESTVLVAPETAARSGSDYEWDETTPFLACCIVIVNLLLGPLGVVVLMMALLSVVCCSLCYYQCCAYEHVIECNSHCDSASDIKVASN